jgi:predicted ATPase/DNA-binding SARP family transcriptional activator/class 3 adenylate cyclase
MSPAPHSGGSHRGSMDAPWRIELLGWLRATRGDQVLRRFRMQKAGLLLAYLAYYPHRSHTRAELIELLWPECEPEVGRHNLRQALFSLRRQLEPPGVTCGTVILADRASLRLIPAAVSTDVAQFQAALQAAGRTSRSTERARRLTEAVELYRGELLPGYHEDWVLSERQRLAEAFSQALEELIALLEAAGELRLAIQWAWRAIGANPLREEAHHALIRLLAASDRPAAALSHYQEWERLLARELNCVPAAQLRALAVQIETMAGRAVDGREGSGPGAPRATVSPPDPSPPLARSPSPTGTVTFLAAEIEGLTEAEQHREALRAVSRRYGGTEATAAQASFVAAFQRAADALAAAVAAYEVSDRGERRLRVALHTGDVEGRDAGYQGPALRHALRLLLAAHPGQILLSAKSATLLRDDLAEGRQLVDLGLYRLRDGAPPEALFQLVGPEIVRYEFPPPNASPALMGSLPLPLTRFFGRTEELARLEELLLAEGARLVTLTGPGGSGKTRLAQELSARLRERLRDAVWFVSLVDLSDPGLIPDKVREAMRLLRSPQVEPLEQVAAFLAQARQPVLLVLDNLEHLLEGGTAVVQTLLGRVGTLTLLATSRQQLDLPGERLFPVLPLPVPVDPNTLVSNPSVQLFLDRAQAVRVDFQVTKTNAAAIAELCRKLEGLPLAIELAAARVGVLTSAQMLARIEPRFELLVSRGRAADPRHRSLRAALDWSYQLLEPELQRFFRRLSVFRGGWTLAAAEAVCQAPRALEYLEQLRARQEIKVSIEGFVGRMV